MEDDRQLLVRQITALSCNGSLQGSSGGRGDPTKCLLKITTHNKTEMTISPKTPWWLARRIRSLLRVMSVTEAVRFALSEKTNAQLRFRLNRTGREISLRGNSSDVHCFEKVILSNEYESPFPADPAVIVDAGANIGLATVYYSQEYPNAKIIAIEPESSNFAMLEKNCAGLANVILMKGALWGIDARLVIKDPKAENWAFAVTESNFASRESVEALTIPGLLAKFGLDCIDILKIDIEGAECELFRSGAASWLPFVRHIVIELHDRFRPGCAHAFYSAIGFAPFEQESRGENIFIKFPDQSIANPGSAGAQTQGAGTN